MVFITLPAEFTTFDCGDPQYFRSILCLWGYGDKHASSLWQCIPEICSHK